MEQQRTPELVAAEALHSPAEAAARLRLLADAGVLLSSSLEWQVTVTGVARLALGSFADWTIVDSLDDQGKVHRVSVQHSDPARAAHAAEYATYAPSPSHPSGVWLALRTGASQLVPTVPSAALEAASARREYALARSLGQASFISVPLVARERILGALTFVRGDDPPPYDADDLAFAEEIARRAALAVDNARLLRNARGAEEESRRAADRLRLLAEASELFAEANLDLPRLLDAIARHLVLALGDVSAVLLPSPEAPAEVVPAAVAGREGVPMNAEAVREQQARVLSVLEWPRPTLAEEAFSVEEARRRSPFLRAWPCEQLLLAPLALKGRAFGALAVARRTRERPYTADDEALLGDLAHRAALAIENARLYRLATDAVNARDGFLSVAGHELKTPLTALQLQLRCLRREAEPVALTDRVRKISRQTHRLAALVDELLDVSRITAGRLRLEREDLELTSLVRERVSGLAEALDRAECDVRILAPDPVRGCWDRARLEQVVTNLLTNAIKYGGDRPIDISVAWEAQRARLEVRDQGIGIAPEDQSRIFERFERAVSSRHFGGLGLGLWITRQIVEAHGGSIRVHSLPGEGATFTVELPPG